MSILIKGVDMPKQTEVQTDKGTLKLWTIRNWKVGQDVQFGAAKIPCDLSFNHDGTIHLSVLGRNYSLTEVSTPHGDLIDKDLLLKEYEPDPEEEQRMKEESLENYILMTKIVDIVTKNINEMPVIIEAEKQ